MRHLNKGRTLNRKPAHRKAMLINLAVSILDKERVYTTLAKAKEVRGVVEHLITLGKRGGLHAIRQVAESVHDKSIVSKVFGELAAEYKSREGGYTRIIKFGVRKGDAAPVALIELVGRAVKPVAAPVTKGKGSAKKDSSVPVESESLANADSPLEEKAKKTKKKSAVKKTSSSDSKKEIAKK